MNGPSDISPDRTEWLARLGLAASSEAGDYRLSQLVAEYGAAEVWQQLRQSRAKTTLAGRAQAVDLDSLQRLTDQLGLRFMTPGDQSWPAGLADLDHIQSRDRLGGMPLGLWLGGPGGFDDQPRIAMVGSRAATAYGEHVTADLAAGLAEQGWVVVSGGAYGIDAAAHRAALAVDGRTIALMAGGLDGLYPPGNANLLGQILRDHLVISEYPPTCPPSRPRFLARNRLIAAISQATVIVEGGVRSGASNTVHWAQSLGRPVLAVPGPVTSAMSYTPHRLIRDGEAVLVTSAEEVLDVVQPFDAGRPQTPVALPLDQLDPDTRSVHQAMPSRRAIRVDYLSERTGLGPVAVLTALGRLAGQGLAEPQPSGEWKLCRTPIPAK